VLARIIAEKGWTAGLLGIYLAPMADYSGGIFDALRD